MTGTAMPIRTCAAAAAHATGITANRILCQQKSADVSLARHIAFWLARREGHRVSKIARSFERDHTTIDHGLKRIDRQARTDSDLIALLDTAVAYLDDRRPEHDAKVDAARRRIFGDQGSNH